MTGKTDMAATDELSPWRPPLHLVQLTDTHVVASDRVHEAGVDEKHLLDPNRRLAMTIESIGAEPIGISAVVATGDLTNDGRPDEYEALGELLDPLDIPVYAVPGNHDDRASIRALFPHLPWADSEHASWVVEHQGITIVGLDSTRPPDHGAAFDDDRAAWLDSTLSNVRENSAVLLAMHHPPFRTGIGWMDRSGFTGLDRFAEVIAAHRVDRILCGHMHRPMNSIVGGTIAQVGLSTVQHVALNLDPSETSELWMIDGPPGYLIHRHHEGSWVTHTRYIDRQHEPFVPAWSRPEGTVE